MSRSFLFLWTGVVCYTYVLMEWLFFATKPSFLSGLEGVAKVEILLISGGVVFALCLIPILVCFACSVLFRLWKNLFLLLAGVVPAFLQAALALLLVDNFTYTLFKVGIVSSYGVFRTLYLVLFVFFFVVSLRWIRNLDRTVFASRCALKPLGLLVGSLVGCSVLAFLHQSDVLTTRPLSSVAALTTRPNILILGGDGINAVNTSLYGYSRDTTPFLKSLAASSLVADNAFANAGNSTASIVSMLTGKLPSQTRVLYTPDILTGANVYQHLPGILRRHGYHTVQLGIPNFVDAYEVNLQDGFDVVNDRSMDESVFFRIGRRLGFGNSVYFCARIADRVMDRLLHIAFVRPMSNSFKLVTRPDSLLNGVNDRERVDRIVELFAKTQGPLFIHAHLMGTHGPQFCPRRKVFSKAEDATAYFAPDAYDDAILDFDAYINEICEALAASGQLDKTIIVIYSDHNMLYSSTQRIPLLFHFPGKEHAGRIQNNVQNLDIAPTLLQYLGLNVPSWMSGVNLLQGDPPADRLIFSMGTRFFLKTEQRWELDTNRIRPPFYQFAWIAIIAGKNWVYYDLEGMSSAFGTVSNSTSHSLDLDMFPKDFVFNSAKRQMEQADFDVSQLVESRFTTVAEPTASLSRSRIDNNLKQE